MSVSTVAMRIVWAEEPTSGPAGTESPTSTTPSSSTTPGSGASHGLPVLVPTIVLIVTVLVIVLALGFALIYHWRLIDVLKTTMSGGHTTANIVNDDSYRDMLVRADTTPPPTVLGAVTGPVGSALQFQLVPEPDGEVFWIAPGGDPSDGSGRLFTTAFAAVGDHTITVRYQSDQQPEIKKATHVVKVVPTAGSSVTLPFVLRNWGRLVTVLFGTGIIATLMALGVLDSAAGVGILGTLLGVGAATAMTPNNDDDKPKK